MHSPCSEDAQVSMGVEPVRLWVRGPSRLSNARQMMAFHEKPRVTSRTAMRPTHAVHVVVWLSSTSQVRVQQVGGHLRHSETRGPCGGSQVLPVARETCIERRYGLWVVGCGNSDQGARGGDRGEAEVGTG